MECNLTSDLDLDCGMTSILCDLLSSYGLPNCEVTVR